MESIDLIMDFLKDKGCKVTVKYAHETDETIGSIVVQELWNPDQKGQKGGAFIKIMEIDVNGPILTCKSDHVPLMVNGQIIDLHEPDSLGQLQELLEQYKKESQ